MPEPRGPTALLVLGDAQLKRLVRVTLEEFGFVVLTSPSPARPLELVVDVDDMPVSATTLVPILRHRWGDTVPFLLVGRQANLPDLARQVGAVGGLRKPLNTNALVVVLRGLVPDQ